MKVQPRDKRTEDESAVIDFALIYESILPKMHFYEIKNIVCLQGFDLVNLLTDWFKFLGIEFSYLPISYQSIHSKINLWMVWYDDRLRQKLLEFYYEHIKYLGIDDTVFKLYILPSSLWEDEAFNNILQHQEKFRIIAKRKELITEKLMSVVFEKIRSNEDISDNIQMSHNKYRCYYIKD